MSDQALSSLAKLTPEITHHTMIWRTVWYLYFLRSFSPYIFVLNTLLILYVTCLVPSPDSVSLFRWENTNYSPEVGFKSQAQAMIFELIFAQQWPMGLTHFLFHSPALGHCQPPNPPAADPSGSMSGYSHLFSKTHTHTWFYDVCQTFHTAAI